MPNFDYDAVDFDDEIFSSEISLDLLERLIIDQFDDPLETRKRDHINSYITKYEYEKDNTIEDDMYKIESEHEKFLVFMVELFEKRLNIGFPTIDNMNENDQHELIHLTYLFFIKNIKKNFTHIILNFIDSHHEYIEDNYERRDDVTANNFKEELIDEFDIIVLSNLGDIINDILEEIKSYDVYDFFKLARGDEVSLELEFVNDCYDRDVITGNFISAYVEMLDSEFKIELQSKVRNKILKRYPYRKKDMVKSKDNG